MLKKDITYNLRNGGPDSDRYYIDVEVFSDDVLVTIEKEAGNIISEYIKYLEKYNLETIRSRGEYAVEFLTLGLSWKRYLGAAQKTSRAFLEFMVTLFKIRSESKLLKEPVDKLRGLLSGMFISPTIHTIPSNNHYSLYNFKKLLLWLEASGEFKDEVKRLRNWFDFCVLTERDKVLNVISKTQLIINWFEVSSNIRLGKYTAGIEKFLSEKHPKYRYREDEIFTGKSQLEYYLNMVGAEIMNRGFRGSFKNTETHVLLLPGCLRPNEQKCKAVLDGEDLICKQCSKDCRINKYNRLGKENSFKVCIVPHSSGFTKYLKRWQKQEDTGIIAVACLLNLVPGGYEMRELNLKSQCVLLDYCGCKKHWDENGIPTDLNENKIIETIRKEKNYTNIVAC